MAGLRIALQAASRCKQAIEPAVLYSQLAVTCRLDQVLLHAPLSCFTRISINRGKWRALAHGPASAGPECQLQEAGMHASMPVMRITDDRLEGWHTFSALHTGRH
jgi:hypothetical protein